MKNRAGLSISVLLLLGATIVALLTAETGIRVFYPQRLYYNVSQWDPYVGFIPIPGIESHQKNLEFDMYIKINSRGLRDREFQFEKPDRTLRIGVFGDSFTFGEGVQAEETYPKQLERLFAEDSDLPPGWRVEVMNFGIGKTGTSHQLAWYQKEGRRYGLDLVIVGFLSGNDFVDNLKGVFRLRAGVLVHNPAAYSSLRRIQGIVYSIPGYRWLAEHSHLLNLARKVASVANDRSRRAEVERQIEAENSSLGEQAVPLTKHLIAEFRKRARQDGAEFVVLSLPARGQRRLEDYGPHEEFKAAVRWLAQLESLIAPMAIDVIDLVPVFAALPAEEYYYELDGHWRPAGHRVVAQHVHAALREKVYRRIRATGSAEERTLLRSPVN